jgi:hypothetical protein
LSRVLSRHQFRGATTGISWVTGGTLQLETCSFIGAFTTDIRLVRFTAGDVASLFVTHSSFSDWTSNGILISNGGANAKAIVVIHDCSFTSGSNTSVNAGDNSQVFIASSRFRNSGAGVNAYALNSGQSALVEIDRCEFVGNAMAMNAGNVGQQGTARIRVARSTIAGNTTGIQLSAGGAIDGMQQGTAGTNFVEGNANGDSFSTFFASK